jgi:hypothetical protein
MRALVGCADHRSGTVRTLELQAGGVHPRIGVVFARVRRPEIRAKAVDFNAQKDDEERRQEKSREWQRTRQDVTTHGRFPGKAGRILGEPQRTSDPTRAIASK